MATAKDRNSVWRFFENVRERMNDDGLFLEEIAKALSIDELQETLEYIDTCWDLGVQK